MTNNQTFFEFEIDFVESLRCIPMQVRYKLDTSGIKLKLSDWHQMSQAEREALVELPCITETEIQSYRQYLEQLIFTRTGVPAKQLPIEPQPEWMDSTNLPASVQAKAQEVGLAIATQKWEALTPLQRFALIKLSRSGHENKNFPKAVREFHLA
ncbi:nitrate reductase associated protein [Tolypothrix sp. FACHB-123]|uniref:nitrate reductase associated protein n=1 Tax=Tolypothrix sp. FACHB-123 TaxID=2692868 RepID=UPI00168A341D|nr:nitrate reductase associated protein [Tolypothrix sp. FACHB-123]MBD2353405.1 nitrate reductase associated protein [Tolypothrix sp. FACHB-123]